jgi:hypothetical protein
VAGEGIALAIATAVLAALSYGGLAQVVPQADTGMAFRIAEAAQRLTNGDMTHAVAALPQVPMQMLAHSYSQAFNSLLHVLIAITLLSAFASFAFLSRTGPRDDVHNTGNAAGQPKAKVTDSAVA